MKIPPSTIPETRSTAIAMAAKEHRERSESMARNGRHSGRSLRPLRLCNRLERCAQRSANSKKSIFKMSSGGCRIGRSSGPVSLRSHHISSTSQVIYVAFLPTRMLGDSRPTCPSIASKTARLLVELLVPRPLCARWKNRYSTDKTPIKIR